MSFSSLVQIGGWFFLLYFAGLHLGYLGLNLSALLFASRAAPRRRRQLLSAVYRGYEPSVSLIVPAYNEEATILDSLRTSLGQDYPAIEVVIVNDGSRDGTLGTLVEAFELEPFDLSPRSELPSKTVRTVYRSRTHPSVRVIDKENGGKADALNAGLNYARHDLVCTLDADSVLEPHSIRAAVQPFQETPETIAVGGTIMVLNGCTTGAGGFVRRAGLQWNYWALIQTLEYLRAFLLGRLGWAPMNAMYLISGAFGVFRRDVLVEAGGYRTDSIGEDLELTLRLHRHALARRRPYRIGFVPEPVCWTEVPTRWTALQQQRIRWHQGLSESVAAHKALVLRPGLLGWVSFPFLVVFEWLSPIIEVIGYLFVLAAYLLGFLSDEALVAFLIVAIGLGILLSVGALLLEQLVLRSYKRLGEVLVLVLVAFAESFGFRQIHAAWRLIGLLRWATRAGYAWS